MKSVQEIFNDGIKARKAFDASTLTLTLTGAQFGVLTNILATAKDVFENFGPSAFLPGFNAEKFEEVLEAVGSTGNQHGDKIGLPSIEEATRVQDAMKKGWKPGIPAPTGTLEDILNGL